ncbi:MAG: hypothetical protein AB8H79_19245 [Myxococcota bacterium]
MAKGSYRLKRIRVLEELRELDPTWADQVEAMRSSEPQSYRKEMLKVDAWISAKTGRPTTLSMRRKRFGGDEDPALVRRVQELREAMPELTRGVDSPIVIGGHAPRAPQADLGGDDGWVQDRTPAFPVGDLPPAEGHRIPAQAPQRTPDSEEATGDSAAPDLSVLSGRVGDIKKALNAGTLDGHLAAVEAAERAGKSRTGVLAAIEGRKRAIA